MVYLKRKTTVVVVVVVVVFAPVETSLSAGHNTVPLHKHRRERAQFAQTHNNGLYSRSASKYQKKNVLLVVRYADQQHNSSATSSSSSSHWRRCNKISTSLSMYVYYVYDMSHRSEVVSPSSHQGFGPGNAVHVFILVEEKYCCCCCRGTTAVAQVRVYIADTTDSAAELQCVILGVCHPIFVWTPFGVVLLHSYDYMGASISLGVVQEGGQQTTIIIGYDA